MNKFDLNSRTHIMGILNVTPDSFYDGGKFFSYDNALYHGEKMAELGADIIDVGGESTRPFSKPISIEEEIKRVVPVIESLVKRISIPISIDTTKSIVAKHAIEAGASIINDISAFRFDPDMVNVAKKYDTLNIIMHIKGNPSNMQIAPVYENLIGEIKLFLKNSADILQSSGIPNSKIIIDPGIGFGKTAAHNLQIIKNLNEFKSLNYAILIGPSRKWFIRNLLKDKNGNDIKADLPVAGVGTQAAIAACILNGANIIRVHDVADTLATAKIIDAIKYCAN